MQIRSTSRCIIITVAAWTMLSIAGCYQSPDITWYKAGHYKGAHDPLLERLKDGDLQKQLAERVREVQSDR